MTNQIQLLPEDSEYRDLAVKAKELSIPYVGINKKALLEKINEKITKINNGEINFSVQEQNNNQEDNSQDQEQNDGERTVVKRSTLKWYEEDGAFPYKAGDIVTIVSGKDLHGRKLQISGPSNKQNMVKGQLIHPTNGTLQNTVITISFDRLELDVNYHNESTENNETVNDQNTLTEELKAQ